MKGISVVAKIEKGFDRYQIVNVPPKFGMSQCGAILPKWLEFNQGESSWPMAAKERAPDASLELSPSAPER